MGSLLVLLHDVNGDRKSSLSCCQDGEGVMDGGGARTGCGFRARFQKGRGLEFILQIHMICFGFLIGVSFNGFVEVCRESCRTMIGDLV